MNIKDQILLSVILSIILVVAISGSIVVSYQDMQETQHQEDLAADVVRGAYELTYLSNDYLVNADPRARTQWEERYASLQTVISQLKPGNQEEVRSIESIGEYNEKIGMLFREIPEPGTLSAGAVLFSPGYQQIMWSRNGLPLQGLIYEAWRLRHLYDDDVSEARVWNNILILALMVSMLAIICVNYMLISRRLIRSIRDVNDGIVTFSSGNLGYRIPVTSDDEIGGIARGLNMMAEHVQSVTASRDELNQEIEERKRVENALRESERKFRETVKSLDEAYYSATLEGLLLEHNVAFNRILGIDVDRDMKGFHLPDFWQHPEDRKKYVDEVLANRFVRNFTIHAKTADGKKIVVLANAHLFSDDIGQGQGIEGTFLDITDLNRAEEALKASEEKFSTAFRTSPYAITITRVHDGRFIEVNEAFAAITGFSQEETLASSSVGLDLWVDGEDRKRVVSALLDGRSIEGQEFLFRRKNGELMTGTFSARIISLNNEPCILSSINDITGRKEIEGQREALIKELEEKNDELERFTYTVSHDLKSPLITIRGFIGLLQEDATKGDTLQMDRDISRIFSATDKMQELLSGLLTLSRIGRIINPPERVNFATIAEEARELLLGTIREHGVTVTLARKFPDVFVDHARIREVVTNLIENAIKFRGHQHEPIVEIGVRYDEDHPVFSVRDNGIGIEPQYLTRIFNLFEKLDPKTEGTGVGLAIVKRIIEVHGGRIWVESAGPGQGSTFFFTLPVAGGSRSGERNHTGMR